MDGRCPLPATLSLALAATLALAAISGCAGAPPRSAPFALEDRTLPPPGAAAAEVSRLLGAPAYITGARNGAETWVYFDARLRDCRKGCAEVVVQNGRVASVRAVDERPPIRAPDAVFPKRRVTDGRVRLGMPEDAVWDAMGEPTGLTAHNGVETFHYVTWAGFPARPRVDSQVVLIDARVVAFHQRFLDGYAPDLPVDAGGSPSAGTVRVGHGPDDVRREVGPPDQIQQTQRGRTVWTYLDGPRGPDALVDVVQYVFFDGADQVSGIVVDQRDTRRAIERADQAERRGRFWMAPPSEDTPAAASASASASGR